MAGLRRLYERWLSLALVLVAVANLVINTFVPISGRPIRLHESGSLTHLVHTDQSTVDRRFGFYLELGDVAAGATLFVPPDSPVSADIARGLSDVLVLERDYDPRDVPPQAAPSGDPIGPFSTGEGDVPYWIIPGSETEEYWWFGLATDGIVVFPGSLDPGRQP